MTPMMLLIRLIPIRLVIRFSATGGCAVTARNSSPERKRRVRSGVDDQPTNRSLTFPAVIRQLRHDHPCLDQKK